MSSEKQITIFQPRKHEVTKLKWKNRDYYGFLDLEFESDSKRKEYMILSIGIVITDKELNEVETYYSLVRPTADVSARVLALTKLNPEDLAKAPTWKEVCKELSQLFEKYPKACVYHFGGDDRRAIRFACQANEIERPFPTLRDFQAEIEGIHLKKVKIFHQSPSLKYLSQKHSLYRGENLVYQEHHALEDAQMLHRVASHFKRRLQFDEVSQEFLCYLKKYHRQIEYITNEWESGKISILIKFLNSKPFKISHENGIGYQIEEKSYQKLTKSQREFVIRLLYLENNCIFFIENVLNAGILEDISLDELQSVYMEAYQIGVEYMASMEPKEMVEYVRKMRKEPEVLQQESIERIQRQLMEELYPWDYL